MRRLMPPKIICNLILFDHLLPGALRLLYFFLFLVLLFLLLLLLLILFIFILLFIFYLLWSYFDLFLFYCFCCYPSYGVIFVLFCLFSVGSSTLCDSLAWAWYCLICYALDLAATHLQALGNGFRVFPSFPCLWSGSLLLLWCHHLDIVSHHKAFVNIVDKISIKSSHLPRK